MRTILLGFFFFFTQYLFAQRECATQQYTENLKASGHSISKNISNAELFIQHQLALSSPSLRLAGSAQVAAPSFVIHIPVVVHVLYNNAAQNISDEQIKSQIDALNRDFRRTNADTMNTPVRFKHYAADIQIEFALATADPKGRATGGIVRRYTDVKEWGMDDKIKSSAQGGDDAWDSHSYLNFWVGNTRNILGYASAVGGPAEKDGIVINTSVFGTLHTAAPYNLGRTAVHETGHWLGLKHIWGDTYCGDDLVDDTPKQGGFTSGCPSSFRTTCSNGSLGDMYMNYMDFTNDACLNLFTEGQKQRMRSLFYEGGPRSLLLQSKGLNTAWVENALLPETIAEKSTTPAVSALQVQLYPNPAFHEVLLRFNDETGWMGKEIGIRNINGVLVQKVMIQARTQTVSISSLQPGIYFLQADINGKKWHQKLVKL